MGRRWIPILLLVACPLAAAVVYKWTDANGVVHYSDQAVEGAERIVTSSGTSNGVGGAVSAASKPAQPAAKKTTAASLLAIESPQNEQVFFGDDVVPVRLHVEPALNPSQRIAWYLNGAILTDQGPTSLSFALPAMPRGSYTLSATVIDSASGQTQTADGVTFYVRQPSQLAPLDPLRKK